MEDGRAYRIINEVSNVSGRLESSFVERITDQEYIVVGVICRRPEGIFDLDNYNQRHVNHYVERKIRYPYATH